MESKHILSEAQNVESYIIWPELKHRSWISVAKEQQQDPLLSQMAGKLQLQSVPDDFKAWYFKNIRYVH